MATFTIVQPRYDDALLKRTTKFNTDKERMSSALVAQLFPKVSYVGRANALRRQRLLIGRDASRGHKASSRGSHIDVVLRQGTSPDSGIEDAAARYLLKRLLDSRLRYH
ncbi:hypothetical protein CIB48_g199 [Xylaria polymorpha]|nr:hypothetical protein CIB48_g199 [Xylaria polymorpha]